ncbi:MAG: tagaturonate epimerase family protein [Promethearchaeota archaeon]
MKLQKYSIGTGDRFGQQGKALLKAIIKAQQAGIDIAIVWNKSHREHIITKSSPNDVLREAKNAVRELGWKGNYYIDADHIGLSNVDLFVDSCNFFTIDVADFIGRKATDTQINTFIKKYGKYSGRLSIPHIKEPLNITKINLKKIAEMYLLAIKEATKIYHRIEEQKGKGNFIVEISMDESELPQTPIEVLFILIIIADENIPIQTFAPRFSGKFYKGIDYIGDIDQFAKEFELLLAIIQFSIKEFSLPDNLKLSIHSGSDKFAIYPAINNLIKKFDKGIHLKTSGTTWLEEIIGLAMAGADGLKMVKEIYSKAYKRFDELCVPYEKVININKDKLIKPKIVNNWTNEKFVKTLRHDLSCNDYNPHFRQLFHIAYKIAAEMDSRYLKVLNKYKRLIEKCVTNNIYEKHLKKLFL